MIAGLVSYMSLITCSVLIVGLETGHHRTYARLQPCDNSSCHSSCSACDLGQQHSPILWRADSVAQ